MIIIIASALLLSITLAILGVISLWKRYIYFADGIAHSGFLTVVIATTLNLPLISTGLFITLIFAVLIFALKKFSGKNESILILANIFLSLALIISSFTSVKLDLTSLLFGNLIAVNINDLVIIGILLIVSGVFIIINYRSIILMVLNADLAKIKGVKVKKIELAFLIILALSLFISINIVGVLLVTTILLLPAMSARLIAKTPLQMILYAVIIAIITTSLGLLGAFFLNLPAAPFIILSGAVGYIGIYIYIFHTIK